MAKRQAAKGGQPSKPQGKGQSKAKKSDARPNCKATTAAGKPCGNKAKAGSDYCGSHSGKVGPRLKLTDKLRDQLANLIKVGNYREHAARAVGISTTTFYRWMETGEADHENDRATPYRELWEAVTRAEDEAITAAVLALRKGMANDWRAAIAFLERKDPDNWGKRQRLEHSGPGGQPIRTDNQETLEDLDHLTVEERRQLLELRRKMKKRRSAGRSE